MANSLSTNPIIVNATGVITTSETFIRSMVFKGGSTDSSVTITDERGNVVIDISALAKTSIAHEFDKFFCKGLTCSAIAGTSAVLYIYS